MVVFCFWVKNLSKYPTTYNVSKKNFQCSQPSAFPANENKTVWKNNDGTQNRWIKKWSHWRSASANDTEPQWTERIYGSRWGGEMSLQTRFNSFRSRSTMQLALCLCLQGCRCPQCNYSRSPNSQADRHTDRQGDRCWGRQWEKLNKVKSPSCAASWPTACGFYTYTVKLMCVSLLFTESFRDYSELRLIQTRHWNAADLQPPGVPTAGEASRCRLKTQLTRLVQTKTKDPQFWET